MAGRCSHHAIAAVRAVATDVVVVAAPGATSAMPRASASPSDPVAFEGPLAGLAAGLAALDPAVDRLIVVAGDMPSLVPAVLDACSISSRRAPMPRSSLTTATRCHFRWRYVEGAPRRPSGSSCRRGAAAPGPPRRAGSRVIAESTWRADDPTASTLHDIDTPNDLPSP